MLRNPAGIQEHRALGMSRPIALRDFLNGVAIGITGANADLVIVGGGISGLSAAYFYQTAPGYAKRNEFQYQGRTYVGFGETMGIATPYPYSYRAKALIKDLGVEVQRGSEFYSREIGEKHNLGTGVFFDKEHFERLPGSFTISVTFLC